MYNDYLINIDWECDSDTKDEREVITTTPLIKITLTTTIGNQTKEIDLISDRKLYNYDDYDLDIDFPIIYRSILSCLNTPKVENQTLRFLNFKITKNIDR